MKKCTECGKEKELDQFYRNKLMRDGHLNQCKECNKIYKRQPKSKEYRRQYAKTPRGLEVKKHRDKKYNQSTLGRAAQQRSNQKYNAENPEKRIAHHKVSNAIRDGKLIVLPCEVCFNTHDIHAHHDDYSKPLDIRWLCRKHHIEHHKSLEGSQ